DGNLGYRVYLDCGDNCDDEGCTNAAGDVNEDGTVNILDIVQVANYILVGGNLEGCGLEAADVNGDGFINILDIVQIANAILGRDGRIPDATSAKIQNTGSSVLIKAEGYIGGIQMTLKHGSDFSMDITDKAMLAEYNTVGNKTVLVIVTPESDEVFTYTGDFEIVDVIVANSQGRVDVGIPTAFSLSEAYPNPFNPTTSLTLAVPEAGQVSVQVYNIMGQVVATLANGYMDASTYTLTWDASNASSGVYFVKAQSAGSVTTQKLMLMK
uniref:dockerin type I domain-containing protein n=2 Tax=Pelagibacter ubique TaxID=198252 RepID=UPI000B1ADC71